MKTRLLIHLFFVPTVVLFLISCKDDDPATGTLTLHFKPTYGGSPLTTFVTYPFENGEQLQFSHLSMLIADLRLSQGSAKTDLDEIELIHMSFDNVQDAGEGYTLKISDVPADNYAGIEFGIGVPADLNEKVPADFPSSNPLSNTGYYWLPWSSYIFMKTEGLLDTLGTGSFDLLFAIHTGSDALFRYLEGPVPITISEGQETELNIFFDYRKILEGVDIKINPQNHSPSDTVNIVKVVQNLNNAVTLTL